jgi:hypothetical protein
MRAPVVDETANGNNVRARLETISERGERGSTIR